MRSQKKVAATVKTCMNEPTSYAFFKSKEYGDVFMHCKVLRKSGFSREDMIPGKSAMVEVVVENSRPRVTKVLSIGEKAGKAKQSFEKKQQRYSVGQVEQGEIKALKRGYGFIAKPGYRDLFFPVSLIDKQVQIYLSKGAQVRFVVQAGVKGLMAHIKDVV